MNIFERMSTREMLSAVLEVPVPEQDPEVILEISRFSDKEGRGMRKKALIAAADVASATGRETVFLAEYGELFLECLRRHVKGWTWKNNNNGPEFNQKNLELFIESLTDDEITAVARGYTKAQEEDREKAQKKITSAGGSGKRASNGQASSQEMTN